MQPGQSPTPQPFRRSGIAPLTVVIIVVAVVALSGLILVGIIGYLVLRTSQSRSQVPVTMAQMKQALGLYPSLKESLPASRAAAKRLVELSHKDIVRVSKNETYNDTSGDFKGYLDFGYRYSSSDGFDVGIASKSESESGSFSTLVAPSHMYFADFRRLRVGQRIEFEEIAANNLPSEKLTQYATDPYLFVRPVAVR